MNSIALPAVTQEVGGLHIRPRVIAASGEGQDVVDGWSGGIGNHCKAIQIAPAQLAAPAVTSEHCGP
jgi:hypothetical protein